MKESDKKRRGSVTRAGLLGTLLLAVLAVSVSGCMKATVVNLPGLTEVKVEDVAERMKGARAVFVGEVHDDRAHHRLQLDVIRTLHERGLEVAVGVEMFRTGSQEVLDRWVAGELPEKELKEAYYRDWHVPARYYMPIFRYARDNSIPLVALNISRELTKKVFSEGIGSLEGEEAGGLEDLECDVDEKYETMIRDTMGEHENMEDSFEMFCTSQMVWDAAMARSIVRYLNANPRSVMVIVAGSGHAWKRGIPRQFRRFEGGDSIPYAVIVPELPGLLDRKNLDAGDADFLLLDPWYFNF